MNFSNSNLQKTIGSFLLLAALTSSSVFLLTNNFGGPAAEGVTPESLSLGGKNVFVESVPGGLDSFTSPFASRSDIAQGFVGKNITAYFTDSLTKELMAANLNGPTVKNGVGTLNVPKNLDQLADISSITGDSFTAVVDSKRLKLVSKYTADDILTYLSNVQTSIDGTLVPGLTALDSKAQTADTLDLMAGIYTSAADRIYAANIPAPLKGFNSALLGLMASQKIFFDQSDPLKTLVALQNPEAVIAPYRNLLLAETAKLQKNLPVILASIPLKEHNRFMAAITNLVGINTAYALLPDIIGGIAKIIKTIMEGISWVLQKVEDFLKKFEWLRKLLTELLKDQLVHKMMAQVTNWVQGGGTPQFVDNWQGFLGDAANYAASGIVSQVAPNFCNGIGPLIKLNVVQNPSVKIDYTSPTSPFACTLNSALANVNATIDEFTNDFSKGSWGAYGALLQPQNNVYGSLVQNIDTANMEAADAAEAAQTDAAAGKGTKSQKDCADSSKTTYTGDQLGNITSEAEARAALGTSFVSAVCPGAPAQCTVVVGCDPGGWKNTTPGGLVAEATGEISKSPVGRIVSAQDITALLTALVNSAFNKLVASGSKGLTSLTQAKLAEAGSAADSCAGLAGAELATCVAKNKDITDTTSGSGGTPKDQVVVIVTKSAKMTGDVLKAEQKLVNAITKAMVYLNMASSTCGTGAVFPTSTFPTEDQQNVIDFVNENLAQLPIDLKAAQKVIDTINASGTTPGRTALFVSLQGALDNNNFALMSALTKVPAPSSTSPDATEQEKFYNKLLTDMDRENSYYGNTLKTLDHIGEELQTSQTRLPEITLGDNGGCGILEKAKFLTQELDNSPSCSMKDVVKYCQGR